MLSVLTLRTRSAFKSPQPLPRIWPPVEVEDVAREPVLVKTAQSTRSLSELESSRYPGVSSTRSSLPAPTRTRSPVAW